MDPEVFKTNLKGMLEAKGMTQRQLAEECGLAYQWVRRVSSRGLTRVEDRNREQLGAICKAFDITPIERLWSPDLHAGWEEAAWYGTKVEEILNATRSVDDFSEFVDISEDSIIELVQNIDRLHTALKKNREQLTQRHEVSCNQHVAKDRSASVTQLRQANEYSSKLRHLFRTRPLSSDAGLWQVAVVVDALFFKKEASRLVTIFRDREQASYEEWLVFFGNRQALENSVAFAFGRFDEDKVLDWLTCNSPPEHKSDETLSDWMLIGRGMHSARQKLSTHGGNVGSH